MRARARARARARVCVCVWTKTLTQITHRWALGRFVARVPRVLPFPTATAIIDVYSATGLMVYCTLAQFTYAFTEDIVIYLSVLCFHRSRLSDRFPS